MKDDKRRERLAKLLGIDTSNLPTNTIGESADEISREADAVYYYVTKPEAFVQKECRQCGLVFLTNQRTVGLCSDRCRQKWLHTIGIEWDRTKSQQERWGMVLPLVVQPHALAALKQVAANLSDPALP